MCFSNMRIWCFVRHDSKQTIFGFWTVVQTIQGKWRCHLGLWGICIISNPPLNVCLVISTACSFVRILFIKSQSLVLSVLRHHAGWCINSTVLALENVSTVLLGFCADVKNRHQISFSSRLYRLFISMYLMLNSLFFAMNSELQPCVFSNFICILVSLNFGFISEGSTLCEFQENDCPFIWPKWFYCTQTVLRDSPYCFPLFFMLSCDVNPGELAHYDY